ncbi:uncharacterized protein LOC141596952 [Silene latifolia]|uniref:uncharacterized protein LOC141596952 n=1 Tax=Silene latifolia TaxID=37657 RepID=UPI003D78AD96
MTKVMVDLSYVIPKPSFHCSLNNNNNNKLFHQTNLENSTIGPRRNQLGRFITSDAKSGGGFPLNSAFKKNCDTCRGRGAIDCPGCKGTGRNKKNGNIFERWKCFECQGFGLKSCPECGKGGLTPEQRGER